MIFKEMNEVIDGWDSDIKNLVRTIKCLSVVVLFVTTYMLSAYYAS